MVSLGEYETLTVVVTSMLVTKRDSTKLKKCFKLAGLGPRMYSHLGYAFGGGEGRNNFFGHIGDKLYAKVNFQNLP